MEIGLYFKELVPRYFKKPVFGTWSRNKEMWTIRGDIITAVKVIKITKLDEFGNFVTDLETPDDSKLWYVLMIYINPQGNEYPIITDGDIFYHVDPKLQKVLDIGTLRSVYNDKDLIDKAIENYNEKIKS